MSVQERPPYVIRTSEFKLNGSTIHVHVLDNGRRVISEEDAKKIFPDALNAPLEEIEALADELMRYDVDVEER